MHWSYCSLVLNHRCRVYARKYAQVHWNPRVVMMPTLSWLAALECCQSGQSWHHDNSRFSVFILCCNSLGMGNGWFCPNPLGLLNWHWVILWLPLCVNCVMCLVRILKKTATRTCCVLLHYIDDLVQDCSISNALAMDILQSRTLAIDTMCGNGITPLQASTKNYLPQACRGNWITWKIKEAGASDVIYRVFSASKYMMDLRKW